MMEGGSESDLRSKIKEFDLDEEDVSLQTSSNTNGSDISPQKVKNQKNFVIGFIRFMMSDETPMSGLMEGWLKAKRKLRKPNVNEPVRSESPKILEKGTFPPRRSTFKSPRPSIKEIFRHLPKRQSPSRSPITFRVSQTSQHVVSDPPESTEKSTVRSQLSTAQEQDSSAGSINWADLWTLHRTEHAGGSVQSDDSCGSGVEVTVNSGGIVYFALFKSHQVDSNGEPSSPIISAACIKFTSSRISTQSEFLGSEMARHLGVSTPQSRVIYSGSEEWNAVCQAVTTAELRWKEQREEISRGVCEEMLEGLRLSRSLLVMGYIDGHPLVESPRAFSLEASESTASSLGRVLLLDLVIRNGDRLACKKLGWRGNLNNIMFTERKLLAPTKTNPKKCENFPVGPPMRKQKSPGKSPLSETRSSPGVSRGPQVGNVVVIDSGVCRRPPSMQSAVDRQEYPVFVELLLNDRDFAADVLNEISNGQFSEYLDGAVGSSPRRISQLGSNHCSEKIVNAFQRGFKEGISDLEGLQTMMSQLRRRLDEMLRAFIAYITSQVPDSSDDNLSPSSGEKKKKKPPTPRSRLVATEPRHLRRKSGSRENLNFDVWPEKMTSPKNHRRKSSAEENLINLTKSPTKSPIRTKYTPPRSPLKSPGRGVYSTPKCSPRPMGCVSPLRYGCGSSPLESGPDSPDGVGNVTRTIEMMMSDDPQLLAQVEAERNSAPENGLISPDIPFRPSFRGPPPGNPVNPSGEVTPKKGSREIGKGEEEKKSSGKNWYKNMRNLPVRLTMKIKGVRKSVKGDEELIEQLEWWDGKIREEGLKICEPFNFSTGFLEAFGGHSLVDSYELKVRLEHVLERTEMILKASATQRPSEVVPGVFIGGVLAAKSAATLERLGISHVLSLCPLDVFDLSTQFEFCKMQHMHRPICDIESENIEVHFRETCNFMDGALLKGGKVLIHCFEGKSRSAAILLAFMMLARNMTLKDAWALLKQKHPEARPNDGFMSTLVKLDKTLNNGVASMEWKNRKPLARFCSACQKMVGFSSDSLRAHMRNKHPLGEERKEKESTLALDLEKISAQLETSLDIELEKSASPKDMAKRQLLAIVGIEDS